jgi:hypothetical protein
VGKPDWSQDARVLAFVMDGSEIPHEKRDDDFCVILNGDKVKHRFEVPPSPSGKPWFRIINTGRPSPEDILDEDKGKPVNFERKYPVLPMAAVVFISRRSET